MTEIARKRIFGKPVDGKPANDGYRCELCGAWIEYRDLGKVLAHAGPLPMAALCRSTSQPILNFYWAMAISAW